MINITAVQEYLAEPTTRRQGYRCPNLILDAGTRAETCISFCRPGEEKADDEVKLFGSISLQEQRRAPFLKMRLSITKRLNGWTTHYKGTKLKDAQSLKIALLKIELIMFFIMRSTLGCSGGNVSLEEIFEESVANYDLG